MEKQSKEDGKFWIFSETIFEGEEELCYMMKNQGERETGRRGNMGIEQKERGEEKRNLIEIGKDRKHERERKEFQKNRKRETLCVIIWLWWCEWNDGIEIDVWMVEVWWNGCDVVVIID